MHTNGGSAKINEHVTGHNVRSNFTIDCKAITRETGIPGNRSIDNRRPGAQYFSRNANIAPDSFHF
jgi:hypothetical protein